MHLSNGWHRLYTISNWIFNIAFINILWIIFTILGLGIFGLFPATAAMFAVARKWIILGERDFNVLPMFWKFYRQDFFKLNGFALLFYAFGFFLYFDAAFLFLNSGSFQYLIPGVLLLIVAYLIILLFFFPVFAHYNFKFFQYLKQAFLLAVVSPLEIIVIVLIATALFGFILCILGIIPLFMVSVLVIRMTYLLKHRLSRIVKKVE